MKVRKIWLAAAVVTVTLALPAYRIVTNRPPAEEMESARLLLSEAEAAGAERWSSESYRIARSEYDSALAEWQRQNGRFIIARDYREVRSHALASAEASERSTRDSNQRTSGVKARLGGTIDSATRSLELFDIRYRNFPFSKATTRELSDIRILLAEGKRHYREGDLHSAEWKINSASERLRTLHQTMESQMRGWFADYPKWNGWVEESIALSKRKGEAVIIVDKMARECRLYRSGKLVSTFDVELGRNWIGDKNMQGDATTPEGVYRITRKKSGGETRYYRALLINYPNDDDRARFEQAKRSGAISGSASIGHLIEIHGHGGKGSDWTDGCVALTNSDMDQLYRAATEGTRVTIVGSTVPVETLPGWNGR